MGESWIRTKMHHFSLSQWLFQSRETSHSPFSPSVSLLSPFPPVYSGIIPVAARDGSSPKWGFCCRGKTAGKTDCASEIPWGVLAEGPGALVARGGAFWRAGNGGAPCLQPGAAPDPEGLSCPRAQRGRNLGRFQCAAESRVTGSIQASQLED